MNVKAISQNVLAKLVGPEWRYEWHFNEAVRHYRSADASRSIRHFEECAKIIPQNWGHWHHLSIVYSQLIGDIYESLRLLRYARHLRERHYTPREGKISYRFLEFMWAAQIGHIANMEHLIKREILWGRDPKRLVLYFPESLKAANHALLEKLGAYITIVRNEAELPHPREAMLSVLEEYYLCESLDGLTKHWWHASSEMFQAWERAGHAPLLKLTDAEISRGQDGLRKLGVPDGAWFACLHVRESTFKQDQGYNAVEGVLSADIRSYLPAIKAITDRGGWVVRVGDPKMQPLPPTPHTVDYAHSGLKSDWMDVFLLGACRFFIGTSSGPAYVPPLFGIPCVLTNWVPTGQRPFNGRDIYIPKLYDSGFPARRLRFAEMMAPPVGYAPSYTHARELGLNAIPNTSEEIRDVVTEMLDRVEGKLCYSERDEALQAAFDVTAETNFCIGNARVGRAFLARHIKLLVDAQYTQ